MIKAAVKTHGRLATIILQMTVIVTVFSQMELFTKYTRPLMYTLWGLLGGYYLLLVQGKKMRLSKFTLFYMLAYAAYMICCMICAIFGTEHLTGRYAQVLLIPMMMSIMGDYYGKNLEWSSITLVVKAYVLAACVFAVWVNVEYFSSYRSWLGSALYAYAQKNSAAQIWCSAVLLIHYFIRPYTVMQKIMWYGLAGYLLFVCALSQCRTALLAMACVFVVSTLLYSRKRWLWLATIVLGIYILYNIPQVQSFINQALLLNKYAGADLNLLSSGRLENYQIALEAFACSPFIGIGRYYVDCSYINVLAESGLIGFLIVESIWIFRIQNNVMLAAKLRNEDFFRSNMLISMTVFYIVESLLEGLPPYGPGVSSFMFWLICEMIASKSTIVDKHPAERCATRRMREAIKVF